MKSEAHSQIEYEKIGSAPQTAGTLEPCSILFGEFGVTSTKPLKGAVTLADFAAEFESDNDFAPKLENARRELAALVDHAPTLRRLRLSAGMSQAKLAAAASTSQAYVARVEAGTLDPGTDMLARLAIALGTDEVTIFAAVRIQRSQAGTKRVG
jgi:ribosome-binding protein aMBF1 (putative translation factor)